MVDAMTAPDPALVERARSECVARCPHTPQWTPEPFAAGACDRCIAAFAAEERGAMQRRAEAAERENHRLADLREAMLDANGAKQREYVLALEAREARLRTGLDTVKALIENSRGVDGLHLNGDIAPWDELRTGGRYEDWLKEFDAALVEPTG